MNEIQCAVLRVQLGRLDSIINRLRERRNWILDAIRKEDVPFTISPSADLAGDCGNNATFLFDTPEVRAKAANRAREIEPACTLQSPIDSGLHVYTNWTVLLKRQGGFCQAMNPFQRPENQSCRMTLTPDSCPKTLAILARTGCIGVNINWTREQCETIADALCRAAQEVAVA